LILSADWVVPVEGEPIRDGAVVVEDGRIAAVGPAAELGEGTRHEGCVIAPGFVNAHSHLEYAVYAGFGDGQPFGPWLKTHVERKDKLSLEEMEDVARLGAAECLASGITTVGDCSYSGAAATACAEFGLRATVYLEVFGIGAREQRFDVLRERIGELPERVRIGVSPHAPYTCDLELYRACAALGLPTATHFRESEVEHPLPGLRPTSIGELAEASLLGSNVVAAHCVHVTPEEIELLARYDVAVAHCPRSNAMLGCGIAPLAELRSAGLRIGLGTDSPASAPSFDLFEELRSAVFAARARERNPEALTAAEALRLATLGGAEALGLADEVGSLTPGKRADLFVLDLADSAYHPWEDPVSAAVLGGAPERVITALVDGEARYRKGEVEWHELRRRAASARSRMLAPPAQHRRLPGSAA
jgi:5-methylthioadenosine/S-adenosylhomocysteine deaminase